MQKSAKTILNDCLNVKRNEKVLIIADSKTKKIGEGILNEARKITNASLKIIPVGKHDGEEPPKKIAEEMLFYDVIIAPTTTSLTHTKAVQDARKNARIATLPGITNEIMNGSLLADYNKIEKFTKEVFGKLKNSKEIKVMTPTGSDFVFSAKDRNWLLDTGIIHNKGRCGNLPAGEVFIAPVEGSFDGKIVIDFFKNRDRIYAKKGTEIEVRRGLVIRCSEKSSKINLYFKNIKNADNIAEFGIGTNYKAKLMGNILNDEKVLGTVHVAFGNNSSIGGRVYSELHLDTVLQKATIVADGEILMKNGRFFL